MKLLKHIAFIPLFFNAAMLISQNKKVISPPPLTNPPPQAHFSWVNACFGDTTCFVNQSILANTYTWTVFEDTLNTFGFPVKKVLQKGYNDSIFCYRFYKIGTFYVTLTCFDNHWDSITEVVNIDTMSKLSFYYFGCRDVFVNQSSCISSFLWNFGDGHTSTLVSPVHQYADTGYYTVSLIGYNGTTSDTLTQQVHIPTVGFVNPAFTYTVSHDTIFAHAIDSAYGTNYNWTWNDGTYGSGRDTFHVYKDSTASYAVTLFNVNACGYASTTDTVKITQQPPPLPNFSFINTCLGDTTCFINQTLGGITYTWTVHDTGSFSTPLYTSNAPAICYRFPSIGNYSVTLTTNNSFYTESVTQVITIGTTPIAGFSFIHCSNNFINNSSCATSFYWNFGDGTFSNLTLPSHQYADTGYYQVTLTAYNGTDSNKLTQPIHVDITSAANANFTTHSSNDTLWAQTTYTSIPAATYNWVFGDGGLATGKNATHIYADTVRTYYVKLTVNNACGSVSKTDTVKITVPLPPPDLDFLNSILSIVPNPVINNGYIDAFFNAYAPADYLTQVYNAIGQKVFEEYFSFETGVNEFKINSVNLSSGVYIMVMQSGNSYIRKKFYVINTQ